MFVSGSNDFSDEITSIDKCNLVAYNIFVISIKPHNCADELRNADLKSTPARLGVLTVLEHSDLPLDVRTISLSLRKRGIDMDKVTLFRIVRTLTEKGILKSIQFNEGKSRYEYAGKPEHHHFICERCGRIEDIGDCNVSPIITKLIKTKGVLVRRHSLEFFGLCADCQS